MLACQRQLFSIPDGVHYLNAAYMSPLSKRVEEAGIAGIRKKRVPSDIVPSDFFEGLDTIRKLFARLIGSSQPSRVAVNPSASYGLATAARNIGIQAGQNVVTVAQQFPSNVYVWRRLTSDSRAILRVVDVPSSGAQRGEEWNARIMEAIDRDTAAVAIEPVHWTDGTMFSLGEIGARARDVGAAFLIDGTQAVGAMPFDVNLIQPDALICAGYKWLLGPYGIGVTHFGPRFDHGEPLEEPWINRRGSEDFAGLVDYQDAYRPGAIRYDAGEMSNFALVPMLVAALEQVREWDPAEIQSYCRALTDELVAETEAAGFGVEATQWRAGHIVGLEMPEHADREAVRAGLAARGIHVSVRGPRLRISPHIYNDQADIHALSEALTELVSTASTA